MEKTLEITVSPCYNPSSTRRIRLLKLLRIALIACLLLAWTYGIAIAAAFLEDTNGSATQWMLFFAMFTLPATALLVMVCLALRRLIRAYDYFLQDGLLEIFVSNSPSRRKLVTQVNCHSIVAFAPIAQAASHSGRTIRATAGASEIWALDVRHEGQTVRLLLQPNEAFCQQLKTYVK